MFAPELEGESRQVLKMILRRVCISLAEGDTRHAHELLIAFALDVGVAADRMGVEHPKNLADIFWNGFRPKSKA